MKISIVIPVYNEADQLDACLKAIAAQQLAAFEVIVVDNNSTDATAAVASRFPFVRLLREPRQGVVHARNRGFDDARGDIIGRIDADTILPSTWTTTLRAIFADQTTAAVSGSVTYHDLPYQQLLGRLDLHFRQRIATGMGDEVFLYGANMAVRTKLWQQVRSAVCSHGGLHEDFDLAIHLQEAGGRVIFDRQLCAEVSLRRFNTSYREYWQYVWLSPRTYALHGRTSQRHMYGVICLVVSSYWAIKLLYRSYDPDTTEMSWRNLWASSAPIRVNPAQFVD